MTNQVKDKEVNTGGYVPVVLTKEQLRKITMDLFVILHTYENTPNHDGVIKIGRMMTRLKLKETYFQGTDATKSEQSQIINQAVKVLKRADYIREWIEPTTNSKYFGVSPTGRTKYKESLENLDEAKPF